LEQTAKIEGDSGMGGEMSETIVYVDTSEVRPGALEDLKTAIKQLADFVDAKEPRIIAYNVYLSEDGTQMTVMQVHPDSASLEFHLEVAGPAFRKFPKLINLSSIHIYGKPSDKLLVQLGDKARLLGHGSVVVHEPHAGFARFGAR
jgi:quinol monooxygenase YgiN